MQLEVETTADWWKLLAGLAVVFVLFHVLAQALGSDRGQAGIVVGAVVVGALLAVEHLLSGRRRHQPCSRWASAGPQPASLSRPLFALHCWPSSLSTPLVAHPDWPWLLPGLFAQAGIAEEALFRGYLFARLRRGRSFWRAAVLSTAPFVAVHLILFVSMPWPLALAAVLLSVILSFPLARLFELGGNTIWAPALLHFTVQGAIKVLEVPGDTGLPLVWMAASAVLPFAAFLVRPRG